MAIYCKAHKEKKIRRRASDQHGTGKNCAVHETGAALGIMSNE